MLKDNLSQQKIGLLNALGSFLAWGLFLPTALRTLGNFESPPSAMVIRVFWAFGILFLIQFIRGKLNVIYELLNIRIFFTQLGAAFLIAINWFVFIYAIKIGQLNQAALGYYIMPLIGVALSTVIFKERLSRKQVLALSLAALGILWTIYITGSVPLISLGVALSFTFYGILKKNVSFDPLSGLFLETLLMIIMIPFIYYLFGMFDMIKIIPTKFDAYIPAFFVGLFTILPLFFFTRAIRQLDYSLYSVLSWFVPSMQFITSVFFWNEPFDINKLITFIFIWGALIIYGYSLFEAKKVDNA